MEKPTRLHKSELLEAKQALGKGDIVVTSQLNEGSNTAFLVQLCTGSGSYVEAIYKPRDGERFLQDFPEGSLYKREYASYLISRILGWPNIPITTIRDGPYGLGSMQLFVDHDPSITYFDLINDRRDELHKIAVFDALVNNADRKAGHCLLGHDNVIWSIDHGLTMHASFKVRTVMLELWGQPYPKEVIGGLELLSKTLENKNCLSSELSNILDNKEISSLEHRLRILLKYEALPSLDPYKHVPWPIL